MCFLNLKHLAEKKQIIVKKTKYKQTERSTSSSLSYEMCPSRPNKHLQEVIRVCINNYDIITPVNYGTQITNKQN